MKININLKDYIFVSIFVLVILLYTIDFFLTGSPYSAFHAGLISERSSEVFAINPAYIIIGCLFIISLLLIVSTSIVIPTKGIIFCILFIVASISNGSMEQNFSTCMHNIVATLLTALLATNQSRCPSYKKGIKKRILMEWHVVTLLLIFGFVLAVVKPFVYGIVRLGFSRILRGEITYWTFTGIYILAIVVSLATYHYCKKKICIIFMLLLALMQLAFANRLPFVEAVTPILVYLFFFTDIKKKFILGIMIIGLVLANIDVLYDIFFRGQLNNFELILNHRYDLWETYIKSFLKNPIWGGGVKLLERTYYTGSAKSEIGLLKWYGECGLIVGVFLTVCMFKALFIAVYVLKRKTFSPMDFVMCNLYIACFFSMLLDKHSRILNYEDFFTWFSMFYLLNLKNKTNRMII